MRLQRKTMVMERIADDEPDIFAGAWSHYDASISSSITLDGPTGVSGWLDVSGNERNLLQPTSANQPTYGGRQVNGLNVVDFLATGSQFLRLSAITIPTLSFSILIACVNDSGSTGAGIVTLHTDTGNDYDNQNAAEALACSSTALITDVHNGNTSLALGGRPNGVYSVRKDGTATGSAVLTAYYGQGSGGTASANSTANGTATNVMVGSRFIGGGAATFYDGAVCEVVIHSPAASPELLQAMADSLHAKWNV